ncbi:ethanolamine ammonia-lyase subunit EutC [Proteiniclasticum sp. C24MP]|uniref:ethanolamine ammonia-lyase subunit EutC n=1 Tax=Proteiniclasticum sp. C24MP TaxID=3374101 RepID=UPI00375536C1
MTDNELKVLIEKVMKEMKKEDAPKAESRDDSNGEIRDITAKPIQDVFYVPNPKNRDQYLKLKKKTAARVGIWRTGPRNTTETLLRFRADHAVAQDAVFSYVDEDFLKEMDLFTVQTKVTDKDEYITRPDLGRQFDEENTKMIKEKCKAKPRVQIFVADGLSSTAIEANLKDILPAITSGLKGYGIDYGTPFFVKYGRVGSMDEVSQALDAELTILLIGERPGLATGESMSCYMTYKGYPGIPEAKRTVVSNIHKDGTPAAEAGAHIASVIKVILEKKMTGVGLNL